MKEGQLPFFHSLLAVSLAISRAFASLRSVLNIVSLGKTHFVVATKPFASSTIKKVLWVVTFPHCWHLLVFFVFMLIYVI